MLTLQSKVAIVSPRVDTVVVHDTIPQVLPAPPTARENIELGVGVLGTVLTLAATYFAWRALSASTDQAKASALQLLRTEREFKRSTAARFMDLRHQLIELQRLAPDFDNGAQKGAGPGNHGLMKTFVDLVASLMDEHAGALAAGLGHSSDEWHGMTELAEMSYHGRRRGVVEQYPAFAKKRQSAAAALKSAIDRLDLNLSEQLSDRA